ncbi:MAG: ferritin family protein [Thermoprotei archaeon]|nr:ferritin family protein [TACK group archaeon]
MGFARDPIELSRTKKMNKEEIALALRDDLEAELDAANLYLEQAELIDDEQVKATLLEVAKEEKVHFGEFLTLLKKYDQELTGAISDGEKEVSEKAKRA